MSTVGSPDGSGRRLSSGPVFANRRNDWEYQRPLEPGERIIDGRVYYSAAWLDRAPVDEPLRLDHPSSLLHSPPSGSRTDLEQVE